MDEKSFQFLGKSVNLPAAPGGPRRVDAEYKRNGTDAMLAHVEPLTGKILRRGRGLFAARDVRWPGSVRSLMGLAMAALAARLNAFAMIAAGMY